MMNTPSTVSHPKARASEKSSIGLYHFVVGAHKRDEVEAVIKAHLIAASGRV